MGKGTVVGHIGGAIVSTAKSAIGVVEAPYNAAADIVSGKNVADTVVTRGSQAVASTFTGEAGVVGTAGSVFIPSGVAELPIVSNAVTLETSANQVAQGNTSKDNLENFYRNYGEGVGAVAGAGVASSIISPSLETTTVVAPVTEGVGTPIASDIAGATLADETAAAGVTGAEAAAPAIEAIPAAGTSTLTTAAEVGGSGALGTAAASLLSKGESAALGALEGAAGLNGSPSTGGAKAGSPKGSPSGNPAASGSALIPTGTQQTTAILAAVLGAVVLFRR